MDVVVFDLELVKRFRKGQVSEIVEIGACKVNLSLGEIESEFQLYISPKNGYITKSTRQFINMTKEDMKKAVPFQEGIQLFKNWLGEDYYLCSWGKDDRLHLINQCLRQKVSLDWFQNYNDLQQQIGKALRPDDKQQLGLKNALDLAGIEAIGKAHRGIDDAINTAKLLLQYKDQIKLQQNTLSQKELNEKRLKLKAAAKLQYKNGPNTK